MFTFAIPIVVLLDTVWVAFFHGRSIGRFKVLRDAADTFTFSSNHGSYTVSQKSQSLTYVLGKRRGSLKLSEIKGIEYRVNEKYAALEELFLGFNMTDLLPAYQDTIDWFSIGVVTSDGKRLPLYISGQYHSREFLLGWYIGLQATLLSRVGLLTDVEEQSRSALELLQARLGGPRLV